MTPVHGYDARVLRADALYQGRRSRYGGLAPASTMLRLTQAPNIAIATLWADLLCEDGMPASVQRQYLGAAAGHLPPSECLPEIWLEHPEHADRAHALLQALRQLPQRRWRCACGEVVEGGFEQCWQCGRLMPQD